MKQERSNQSERSSRTLLTAAMLFTLLATAPGHSADLKLVTNADKAVNSDESDIWTRDKLTGDWGGARKALSDRGIDVTMTYIGETLGTLAGGFRQGVSLEHRFELSFDADLDKLAGLKGASAHTTFYEIGHANGMPQLNYVGSLADPSFIEALPGTRLFTAWFQQKFLDDKVSLRVGQIAADDEFFISQTATPLFNSTFGYAAILAADQFQGGPSIRLRPPAFASSSSRRTRSRFCRWCLAERQRAITARLCRRSATTTD